MEPLAQIGVTDDNLICLEMLKKYGYIDELQEGARFAASLAIRKKLYEGKDLMKVGTKLNTRWNTSLLDVGSYFRDLVMHLNLCPESPGIGLRSLIILGLDYIYDHIKDKDVVLLGDLLDD